jgi:hypothetical protein
LVTTGEGLAQSIEDYQKKLSQMEKLPLSLIIVLIGDGYNVHLKKLTELNSRPGSVQEVREFVHLVKVENTLEDFDERFEFAGKMFDKLESQIVKLAVMSLEYDQ